MTVPKIVKQDIEQETIENKEETLSKVRKSLYKLIYKVAKGNEREITNLYNNLYDVYRFTSNINLPRLAQTSGYKRVVDYAEKNGHIEKLFSLAKQIHRGGVKK